MAEVRLVNVKKIYPFVSGEEKKKLTVKDLLEQFEKVSGEEFANDQALLG